MCEDEPGLEKPKCVEWCLNDALIYEEREEEVEETATKDEFEVALEAMVDTHGWQRVVDAVARIAAAKSGT